MHAEMMTKGRSSVRWPALLAITTALLGGTLWEWRANRSAADVYVTALGQLAQMQSDAEHILRLRQAPQTAASRIRPNEELLVQVERALTEAGIDRNRWIDSAPQPPVRDRNADYMKHTTRLYLDGVTIEALVRFVQRLNSIDPTLTVDGIELTARPDDDRQFDLHLSLSYSVFAPRPTPPIVRALVPNDGFVEER